MHILALETSESIGSLAALEGDRLLAEQQLDRHGRTAQSLAPDMQRLLAQVGWKPADVRLVAVAVGPGSFTGLRIGVTMAKTFAYAVGAEVMGVGTLEAIAARAPADVPKLAVAIDAHRRQVFAATFQRSTETDFTRLDTPRILSVEAWLAGLEPGDWVSGPALRTLAPQVPQGVTMLDPARWAPMASVVGQLGWRHYQAGRRDDLWQLVPQYLRQSAAEEKWDRGHGPAS